MIPARFVCMRHDRWYVGKDGHLTPNLADALRFITPGGARKWLVHHIPDFAEAWLVVEVQ